MEYAVSNGHIDVAKLLIKNNADTAIHDQYGKTALQYANTRKRDDIIKILSTQETIEVNSFTTSKQPATPVIPQHQNNLNHLSLLLRAKLLPMG